MLFILSVFYSPPLLYLHTISFTRMDYLPNDPAILVSTINMLLRDDEFDTLEALCYAFNRNPEEVKNYLLQHDYVYSTDQRQMRPKGYK